MFAVALRSTIAMGFAALLAMPAGLVAQPAAPAQPSTNPPLDLIIAVDVSFSMFARISDTSKPANDPQGIRWDAVQFLIDTANPQDRVALILFRADAALVTRLIDPSGFVTLGSGSGKDSKRQELKEYVKYLQHFERTYDRTKPDPGYTFPGQKDAVKLSDGTGSLPTLRAASEKWNLLRRDADRQKLCMLFTDGMDEEPTDVKKRPADLEKGTVIEWGPKAFEYLEEQGKEYDSSKPDKNPPVPSKEVKDRLTSEVESVVRPFRDAGVPIFTFGLYHPDPVKGTPPYELAMMRHTLGAVSRQSQGDLAGKPQFARIPAYYESNNNIDLLDKLQQVGWELRDRWQIRPNTTPAGNGMFRITTPDRELCDDLGILLYNSIRENGLTLARAPRSTKADGELLESFSHHYVRVRTDGAKGPVEILCEAVAPQTPISAVIGVRPRAPVLSYLAPDPQKTYTPVDAIPIVVAFDPLGNTTLKAEMFEVTARVTGPNEKLRVRNEVLISQETPGGWQFRGEVVPDADRLADGGPTPGLEGLWTFDVTVTAKSGPFAGATRTLLRRQVLVIGYPKLQATNKIEISNLGEQAGKGKAEFTVLPFTPSSINPERDPRISLGLELVTPKDDPAWVGLTPPKVGRVVVRPDGKAVVDLDFTAGFDWAKVPANGLRATITARLPWDTTPVESNIVIRKDRYPLELSGDELTFDLSADDDVAKTAMDQIRVKLKTPLKTSELVLVSGTQTGKRTGELSVTKEGKTDQKATLKLNTANAAPVPGGEFGDIKVEVERPEGLKLESGIYRGTLYLIPADDSRATNSIAVNVVVRVNLPVLLENKKRITTVRLTALSGTKVERDLELALQDPNQKQTIAKSEPKLGETLQLEGDSNDPATRIPTNLEWIKQDGKPDRFHLAVEVPRSVRDGLYATKSQCDVTVGTAKFKVPWRVELEVHRYAVRADVDPDPNERKLFEVMPSGAFKLKPPTPGKNPSPEELSLKVKVSTPFKGAAVRWWAEIVADDALTAKDPMAPVMPATDKPWFVGKVDLYDIVDGKAGQSVTGMEAARPMPISEQSPQNVLVVARNTASLAPGIYACKVRFHGMLDATPGEAKPIDQVEPAQMSQFDVRIEVLVAGRTLTTRLADNRTDLIVGVTSWGCRTGTGQLRSPDLPTLRTAISPAEVRFPVDGVREDLPAVKLAPESGGLTEYRVYWPKKPGMNLLPDAAEPSTEDALMDKVSVWRKPVCTVEPRTAAAGDKIMVRMPITNTTASALPKSMMARVTRKGAKDEAPIDFALTPDPVKGELAGSFLLPTGTPLPPAGEYEITFPPLPAPDSVAAKERIADPVVVLLGLDLKKTDRPVGPIIYGGGFFSTDQVSEPGVLKITNHTPGTVQYSIRVRYPKNVADAQAIGSRDLTTMPLEDFDPAIHLELKTSVAEGTLRPGETVEIGVQAGLSADALDAYLNDRSHPTLGSKNGAVIEMEVTGKGPDGNEFKWNSRYGLVVETQSWRSRGMLYGLVAALVAGVAGVYGYRRYRLWKIKQGKNADKVPLGGAFGEERTVSKPPSNDLADSGPPPDNLFGGPPPG